MSRSKPWGWSVSPRRLRLEGDELDELITLARTRYGADARIVSVERVTVGGIFGFLASRHFEVTVELPDPVPASQAQDAAPGALGLAALIESAELAERAVQDVTPSWRPSTSSADFAELMDSLAFQTGAAGEHPPPRILNPGSFGPESEDPPR